MLIRSFSFLAALLPGTLPVAAEVPEPVVVHTIQDLNMNLFPGFSVAAAGDVDGDGVPDFATSGYDIVDDRGLVQVISGTDGEPLRTLRATAAGYILGETRNLESIGDLNGDGVPELAVTEWGLTTAQVLVFDPATGALVRSHPAAGPFPNDYFALEIAALGDVNGDKRPDYGVLGDNNGTGYLLVYCGASGEERWRLAMGTATPLSLAGAGDLDGDGVPDFVLGFLGEGFDLGGVKAFSSEEVLGSPPGGLPFDLFGPEGDAATLWTAGGAFTADEDYLVGFGVNRLDDLDGDGVPEIATGGGIFDDLAVLSGANGTRIHLWESPVLHGDFPFLDTVIEAESIGDVDGDKVPDIVIGHPGRLELRSGAGGALLHEMPSPAELGDFLGEEIAALGDLDGDGISEIAANDPESGFVQVISFGLCRGEKEPTAVELQISLEGSSIVLTWSPALPDSVLERSEDGILWQAIPSTDIGSGMHLEPVNMSRPLLYRLRYPSSR